VRLTDLDAKFYSENGRDGMGVLFLNPNHQNDYIAVPFENPLDGGPKGEGQGYPVACHWWVRTGDTIETLSLSPSVNAKGAAGWHGWIRNGEAVNA